MSKKKIQNEEEHQEVLKNEILFEKSNKTDKQGDKKEEIKIEKNNIDEKKDEARGENYKLKSTISNKKTLKGDIDFLIPDLKPEELKKV